MNAPASVRATVYGRVQGVFFRAFVEERAQQLGLRGYVRNLPSGNVEVVAEGERERVEKLVEYLKMGPPAARVSRVETTWSEYTGNYSRFRVRY
ncbi:MAG TPA: acylphosphatase [Dehalococcoidia bacterium]|nr:acylphosphatase [Dehalococcoidia bacterium]